MHVSARLLLYVATCMCVCVLLGQRVVQTLVYQRGTLLPWTRSKLPVRHFVSAILFARYLPGYFDLDALRMLRYLFVCIIRGSRYMCKCLANREGIAVGCNRDFSYVSIILYGDDS